MGKQSSRLPDQWEVTELPRENDRRKRIFISHSSKDKDIIVSFARNILQLGLNFEREDIFCTSSEGMGINSGEDWRERIRETITGAKIILLMITSNYKASEICLNEMGAAWLTDAKVIPMLIEDMPYNKVGVIVEPTQMEKVNKEGLNHLQEVITKKFPDIRSKFNLPSWDSVKDAFLEELQQYKHTYVFPKVYSQEEMKQEMDAFADLKKEQAKLLVERESLFDQINDLKKCKDSEEVAMIVEKYDEVGITDRFQELLINAKTALGEVPSIVRTVIYNNRYDKALNIQGMYQEIEEAKSKKLIEEDNGIYLPIHKKPVMKNIDSALDALEGFLDEISEEENEILEEKYKNIDVGDLEFWTDVMQTRVPYYS